MILKHKIKFEKFATGQGDGYKTRCLLDQPYFGKYCQLFAINLSTQLKLNSDTKAIKQIDFGVNLEEDNTKMFSIIEEAKKTLLGFSKRTMKVFQFYFDLIQY